MADTDASTTWHIQEPDGFVHHAWMDEAGKYHGFTEARAAARYISAYNKAGQERMIPAAAVIEVCHCD